MYHFNNIKNVKSVFDLGSFLKYLTTYPGVYRMYDKGYKILYIGKAKNLHKRVNSYFKKGAKDIKTQTLVEQVVFIDVTVTPSDYEAYLLESTLIKKNQPKYNILFKDDKSYPYLHLSNNVFPQLSVFRGKPGKEGRFFGPFVSISSMKETLILIQKIFPIRQCEDSYFNNRSRPCLQYQIKRCCAPCVDKITVKNYQIQVELLVKFMSGKLPPVLAEISQKMEDSAQSENFELAAQLRDQLVLLTKLQQQQFLDKISSKRLHVLGILQEDEKVCLTLVSIEQGKVADDQYWLVAKENSTLLEILEAFLSYYYLSEVRTIWPEEMIFPKALKVSEALLASIIQKANRQIKWITDPIADNAKWQKLAFINARQKLQINQQSKQQFIKRFEALAKWLNLAEIKRIEGFDISHHKGEATVASCVVFNQNGALKSDYRHYNISGITRGDDYMAITQAVTRRVESGVEDNNLPDVMIIDGGKGQIKKAQGVLLKYNQQGNIKLLSLGKGIERISGKEDIFKGFDNNVYHLPEYDLAFLLLRKIRDAAHNFAIKAQRKKLIKRQRESVLESIQGVGSKRRQSLLCHFGGWQELSSASIDEISKVKGISPKVADYIWHAFR